MTTFLPVDANKNPIPALRLRNPGGAHIIAVSDEAARNETAFDAATRIVSLYATVPVFIRFGGVSVTAGAEDHFFAAGLYYDFAVGGGETGQLTHISALRAGDEDGVVYVSERE